MPWVGLVQGKHFGVEQNLLGRSFRGEELGGGGITKQTHTLIRRYIALWTCQWLNTFAGYLLQLVLFLAVECFSAILSWLPQLAQGSSKFCWSLASLLQHTFWKLWGLWYRCCFTIWPLMSSGLMSEFSPKSVVSWLYQLLINLLAWHANWPCLRSSKSANPSQVRESNTYLAPSTSTPCHATARTFKNLNMHYKAFSHLKTPASYRRLSTSRRLV